MLPSQTEIPLALHDDAIASATIDRLHDFGLTSAGVYCHPVRKYIQCKRDG